MVIVISIMGKYNISVRIRKVENCLHGVQKKDLFLDA